jgi:hypothetical protein
VLNGGGWVAQTVYGHTSDIVPRIGTNNTSDSISFPLTSASAFCIFGSVNNNHGLFDVKLSNVGSPHYNGSSSWAGLDTMLYLVTGLDRSQTYQIEMTNDSPGQWIDLSSIVMFDAPP